MVNTLMKVFPPLPPGFPPTLQQSKVCKNNQKFLGLRKSFPLCLVFASSSLKPTNAEPLLNRHEPPQVVPSMYTPPNAFFLLKPVEHHKVFELTKLANNHGLVRVNTTTAAANLKSYCSEGAKKARTTPGLCFFVVQLASKGPEVKGRGPKEALDQSGGSSKHSKFWVLVQALG